MPTSGLPRAAYHVFQRAHLHPTAQEEFRLYTVSPLSANPFGTINPLIEFDHGANSRSVTSRCLRIKYHCSGQLVRTPLYFSWTRHWTSKVAPGQRNVQWAISAIDPVACSECLFENINTALHQPSFVSSQWSLDRSWEKSQEPQTSQEFKSMRFDISSNY